MSPVFRGMVDYAGLFPPASCSMVEAVTRYADYRVGPDHALLGRFVLAAARLDEFGQALTEAGATPPVAAPWPLSLVLGANLPQELERIARFADSPRGAAVTIASIELKVASAGQVAELAALLPTGPERFLEVPSEGGYAGLVEAIHATGAFAKIRTGGVTPDAFLPPEQLTRFLIAVTRQRLPFKATAGLHHPFRGSYPLTYAPDAPRHTMYGFVNLLLATAELLRGGDGETAQAILEEADPSAFQASDAGWSWRELQWDTDALATVRTEGFTSFGSCSFTEPVDELHAGLTR